MKKLIPILAYSPSIILCIASVIMAVMGQLFFWLFIIGAIIMYPNDFEVTEEEEDDVQPK